MNAPQITAVPAVGKTAPSGAGGASGTSGISPATDRPSVAVGEPFAKHLKQLQPDNHQKHAKGISNGTQELPKVAAELLEKPVFEPFDTELLVTSETAVEQDVSVTAEGAAALQQLAQRIQSGEEVAVSSTQSLPGAPATTETTGQPLLASNGLPAAGSNLPHSGDPLPPVNAGMPATANPIASKAVVEPQSQTAESGLLKATQQTQQDLPLKAAPELQVSTPQGEKATVDIGRFATALGAASEAAVQPANSGASPLTASLVSSGLTTPTATSTDMLAQRPVTSMNTPLGEPGWAQEVGSRLQLLVERGNQRAEIRLNPPELGSIEVKVMNDGDRTNVTFFAQNAATREALETALPRLREMFGDSGLQLADANVSQQQTMAGERESGKADGGGEYSVADSGFEDTAEPTVVRSVNGLVDTYI